MPDQTSEQAEVQLEGELEVLYECGEHDDRLKQVLDLGNSQRLQPEFADGAAPNVPGGRRVRVRGRFRDASTLMLRDAGSMQDVAAPAGTNTLGPRHFIVMLVNFQDDPAQLYSPATAHSIAFDQVNRFYQGSSYGQTSVTGDVYAWLTVPMTSTACDTGRSSRWLTRLPPAPA